LRQATVETDERSLLRTLIAPIKGRGQLKQIAGAEALSGEVLGQVAHPVGGEHFAPGLAERAQPRQRFLLIPVRFRCQSR